MWDDMIWGQLLWAKNYLDLRVTTMCFNNDIDLIVATVLRRLRVVQIAHLLHKRDRQKDKQANMKGPIRCSSLMLGRRE
jgi:hypothetical protein